MLFCVSVQDEVLEFVSHIAVPRLFHVPCINQIRKCLLTRPTNPLGFMKVTLLDSDHRTCFDHSSGHLQGGNNKNTNIFVLRSLHS